MTTLKDIAQQAGVSTAAVSTALSGKRGTVGVSAKRRAQIQRIAHELNYRPNPHAASLRTGKTGNLGLYLSQPGNYLAHPQGAHRFWRLCEIASRYEYQVSLLFPDGRTVDERLIDGCLLMDPVTPERIDHFGRLADRIPVLSLVQGIPGALKLQVDHSWHACRRQAARYLYELGHRHIAVVHEWEGSQTELPLQFLDAAGELGIEVTVKGLPERSLERHYRTIDELLAMPELPTAVFAVDDNYARVLIARLMERGLRVPRDVSVFSGSTSAEPDAWLPRMTGLVLHDERQLEGMLRDFIAIVDERAEHRDLIAPPIEVDFIERESCGPPRADSC